MVYSQICLILLSGSFVKQPTQCNNRNNYRMKKLLFLFFFFISAFTVVAQNNLIDAIYLKNGSIIRGTIIEQIPNTSVQIKTPDKSIFTINLVDIEKFTKEEAVKKPLESGYRFRDHGFVNHTELGILTGIGNVLSYSSIGRSYMNDVTGFSFSTVNGWLINPYVSVGIGIGVEKLSADYCMPLYLETRFFVLKKMVTPFFYTQMGYTWRWNRGMSGADWAGLMVSAGAGAACHIKGSASVFFSIGYKIQQIKLDYLRQSNIWPYDYFPEYENSFASFIVFKAGFSF